MHDFILNFRPAKSAKKYKLVWMLEGSPLKIHTEHQAKLLAESMAKRTQLPLVVDYFMNIGNPSLTDAFKKMKGQGYGDPCHCSDHKTGRLLAKTLGL